MKKKKDPVILYFYSTNMMPLLQEIEKKNILTYMAMLCILGLLILLGIMIKKLVKNNIRYNSKFKR